MITIKKILYFVLLLGVLFLFYGCPSSNNKKKDNLTLFALLYVLTQQQSTSSSYCDASTTYGICAKGTITIAGSSIKYEDSSNCSKLGGTIVTSCSKNNALGTCVINSYTVSTGYSISDYSVTYYSGASDVTYTTSEVESNCTSGSGTWTAASIKE